MTASRDTPSDFDAHMMAIALRMARRGLGTTAFNPSVGAVIADEQTGEVIARGWTQPGGRPHAEKNALQRAGVRARGKTMYVTLEPCAHTGRVPTCADAVLTAGLARVVCALADPNPVIAGAGLEQIRAAGVAVDLGLMADEAYAITRGHIHHVLKQRPFVQLKLAVSSDWRVAAGNGAPAWVTGREARAQGHMLRAMADAIITGSATVAVDNPELTCRLPGLEHRSPHRIIADSSLRTRSDAKIFDATSAPARKRWIAVTRATADTSRAKDLVASGRVTGLIPAGETRVDLRGLLTFLDGQQIRRVLVEGGPQLSRGFIDADIVDEAVLFHGRGAIGMNSLHALAGLPFPTLFDDRSRWQLADRRSVGPDEMITYRRIET